ncbi:MAG: ImmA/IrrE family metallo-endopeptidase, partial [Planctomycetes bacterium]|nr:ImmA/IrrE family metallo-endopeptidase [Planctomycetota bacterium]
MNERGTTWTHPSVVALARDGDPLEVITTRARQLVWQAVEKGWEGPPFDPFRLAELLGIKTVPREDIRDARIIPVGGNRLAIEFNPNRPRGRLRYSLAHELAHALFPDCGETIRNRSHRNEISGDEWQLEMLCNVAASELLMPTGTFPELANEEDLSIAHLMALRQQFDVSSEALLLRVVRLTSHPCFMFAAAYFRQTPFSGVARRSASRILGLKSGPAMWPVSN